MAAAAHAVDAAAISFRRTAGTTVTHGERGLEEVVAFRRRWAVIVETLRRAGGIDSLGDEFGDVDDPHPLVDARFYVITDSDW